MLACLLMHLTFRSFSPAGSGGTMNFFNPVLFRYWHDLGKFLTSLF